MRYLLAVIALCSACSTFGQIAVQDLITHSDCTDTTCFAAFAASKGFCMQPVEHEKPSFFVPCKDVQLHPTDFHPKVVMTFFQDDAGGAHGAGIGTTVPGYGKKLFKQVHKLNWREVTKDERYQDPADERRLIQLDLHGGYWQVMLLVK